MPDPATAATCPPCSAIAAVLEEAGPAAVETASASSEGIALFRDFVLADLHHLAAFSFVAILAVEIALVRPGLDAAAIKRLGRIDLAFGIAAVCVLAAGSARVVYGIKGPAYYLGNWVFWTKMAVFALIGFLSLWPTFRILAWKRLLKTDPKALPAVEEIRQIRRLIHVEATLALLLPILGAAMARGYGLP